MEAGKKAKPTEKEISKFFTDNKEKFTTQESVHVRHILVTIDAKDDEKTKAEKKARIENLRKQVVEGADFAEIAKNNSDCPSKENGGDLGEIKKGQTVKPFEDAAFSQEINADRAGCDHGIRSSHHSGSGTQSWENRQTRGSKR